MRDAFNAAEISTGRLAWLTNHWIYRLGCQHCTEIARRARRETSLVMNRSAGDLSPGLSRPGRDHENRCYGGGSRIDVRQL